MTINEKILNCEIEYQKCFCEAHEIENAVRFTDSALLDMYYHNFTLIKGSGCDDEFHRFIEGEVAHRRGFDFCNIVSFVPISKWVIEKFDNAPQIAVNGLYVLDFDAYLKPMVKEGCTIVKMSNEKMADERLRLDIEESGETIGIDFCTRRANRRKKVYLSDTGVDAYICYDKGEVVGSCDLFISNGVAKIEDFAVSPAKQRQGYGSAMLNQIVETAQNGGATTIYLMAYEDDTAKEMYLKNGFKKIDEKIDLFFKF